MFIALLILCGVFIAIILLYLRDSKHIAQHELNQLYQYSKYSAPTTPPPHCSNKNNWGLTWWTSSIEPYEIFNFICKSLIENGYHVETTPDKPWIIWTFYTCHRKQIHWRISVFGPPEHTVSNIKGGFIKERIFDRSTFDLNIHRKFNRTIEAYLP